MVRQCVRGSGNSAKLEDTSGQLWKDWGDKLQSPENAEGMIAGSSSVQGQKEGMSFLKASLEVMLSSDTPPLLMLLAENAKMLGCR